MEEKIIRQAVGIDMSMQDFKVCYGGVTTKMEKEYVSECTFANSEEGFESFLSWLFKFLHNQDDLYFLMEATGVYHEQLCNYLYDQGLNVSVMPSGRVKRYAQSLKQRSKTDLLDAKMLCSLALERTLDLWSPPRKELLALKQLSRERGQLVKEQNVLRSKLHALNHSVIVSERVKSRLKTRSSLLETQILEVEKEMRELVRADEQLNKKIKLLITIPGISFVAATGVVGETLGFKDIKSAKQLTSYVGYDVVHRESGLFRRKTSISKKGNRNVRGMLHMPSMTVVRCNPTLKPFYERLKAKKTKPIIALVAVQRKLLCLMYTLWKNDTEYNPAYKTKTAEALTSA